MDELFRITGFTCDRCGDKRVSIKFADDVKEAMNFMPEEIKERLLRADCIYSINGFDLCRDCYNEYEKFFKKFMEAGKE